MEVREVSKNVWSVKVTEEDKKKIMCIAQKLKSTTPPLPEYGYWKRMPSKETWKSTLSQFCVVGSAQLIEKLMNDKKRYAEFVTKLSIETLMKIRTNREKYISEQLKEFKATRFHNKTAKRILKCLENEDMVKEGKVILLEDLKNNETVNEDQIRNILLKRIPFLKMKSVSDFMISIGATKRFIAFDTRVVGLMNRFFGLRITLKSGKKIEESNKIRDKIGSDKALYIAMEKRLSEVCRDIGVNLSCLDRILFNNAKKSAIEYLLETIC